MLWSVCDTFADATVHAPDAETRGKLERSSAASRAGRRVVTEPGDARLSLHAIWPAMLFELRSLAVDFRPEVMRASIPRNDEKFVIYAAFKSIGKYLA